MTQRGSRSGDPGLLLAGEIGKPHGLDGYVYMVAISDDPHRWDPGAELTRADGATLIVEDSRVHKGSRLLVKFRSVGSRAEAEALRGPVYVSEHQQRELDDDQFWQHDLVGCSVTTRAGEGVGVISGVVTGPVQDLMAVDGPGGGSHLIPLVKAIVAEVDLEEQRVVIDPPDGLLD